MAALIDQNTAIQTDAPNGVVDSKEKASGESPPNVSGEAAQDAPETSVATESASEEPPAEKATPPPNPMMNAPDGGLVAWLQVAGAFSFYFCTWGLVQSFGTYQTYYETDLLSSNSPSAIAWIGSLQAFLLVSVGTFSGPIYDKGLFRELTIGGTFMVVFGMMMTSISKKYYQVILAQGVCVGIGTGLLFTPSVSIVATYFIKKRPFATGIASVGGGVGGTIIPIVFHRIQPRIGFGWAIRVIAFIELGLLVPTIFIMKPRFKSPKVRALIDLSVFKNDVPFTLLSFAGFFGLAALYTPFFFLPTITQEKLNTDANFNFYMLGIINAGSVFGRIIPGYLAAYTGPLNMLVVSMMMCGILAFAWISVDSIVGVVFFSIFYGFFSGALLNCGPAAIASMTPDMRLMGTRMGMSFLVMSFGLLWGNPVAGALIKGHNGSLHLQAFTGAVIFMADLLFGASALILQRAKHTFKV